GHEVELTRGQEQLTGLLTEQEANRKVLESAAADVAAAQAEAQNAQQRSTEAAQAVTDVERRQDARRIRVLDLLNEGNKFRNQVTQSEERVAALDRESERLEREIAAAFADVESMGGRRGQLGIEFESESQKVTGLTTRI